MDSVQQAKEATKRLMDTDVREFKEKIDAAMDSPGDMYIHMDKYQLNRVSSISNSWKWTEGLMTSSCV